MQLSEFLSLTRDNMYKTLVHHFPALAVGKSRATKEVLAGLYERGLASTAPPAEPRLPESHVALAPVERLENLEAWTNDQEPPVVLVQEAPRSGLGAVGMVADLTASLESPVLVEDYPELEARAAATRVNPEMPEVPALATPPSPSSEFSGLLSYRFLEGDQTRDFSPREEAAWRRFVGGMKEFRANPANSGARKWAKQAAVDLKVLGVQVNPSHLTELQVGAKVVRDHRRMRAVIG